MLSYFRSLWERVSPPDPQTELVRLGQLQKEAVDRRQEHARNMDDAGAVGQAQGSDLLTHSRKRMLDAENGYMVALQRWQNRESRQRSH